MALYSIGLGSNLTIEKTRNGNAFFLVLLVLITRFFLGTIIG